MDPMTIPREPAARGAEKQPARLLWLMIGMRRWRMRYIKAEPPCWKGEVQVGPLIIGWQL